MRIPVATYRLQFTPSFGFRDAHQIVPYLEQLGISHIYASPIFAARTGSKHGYDVVDPNHLNPDLGTQREFDSLRQEAHRYKMGWIQDIVPNHMAFDGTNKFLMDVFETGHDSKSFSLFDIDWDHPDEWLKGRLLAPFLGKTYEQALENGEMKLRYDQDGFSIQYFMLRFPLKIQSYKTVLNYQGGYPELGHAGDILDPVLTTSNTPDAIQNMKRKLWKLYSSDPQIKHLMDITTEAFNSKSENLDGLLSEQVYCLTFWKTANEVINYRRFFTIGELISVKVEEKKVFDITHQLIFELCKNGKFSGLRVDHIDGLLDPTVYLKRLRQRIGDIYLVVEKILGREEKLPRNWPVQGTTGYDFMNILNGLFCARDNEKAFQSLYSKFTRQSSSQNQLVYQNKKLIMNRYMNGDIDNLSLLLKKISDHDKRGKGLNLNGLKKAIIEAVACFPVYRTYTDDQELRKDDRAYTLAAIAKARRLNPGLRNELNFLKAVLLLKYSAGLSDPKRKGWINFVMRFQQMTGPLMAKGFEDTTLYIYNRLLSLNEVGGDPAVFGSRVSDWHHYHIARSKQWPHTMNATATHDTKRGEDARSRINVLSEIPDEWSGQLVKWHRLNKGYRSKVCGRPVPDENEEYLLYQTMIGAYPFSDADLREFPRRILEYMIKASREAKMHTDWIEPNAAYETALASFIRPILRRSKDNSFLRVFRLFHRKVAFYGILNSLSQTVLKITATGVPDFYQGTELWDLSLVDPDNRRPVDYAVRETLLRDVRRKSKKDHSALLKALWAARDDGKIKLFLIHRALAARRMNRKLFELGRYMPIEVTGRYHKHITAFARVYENSWAIVIAPRFTTGLVDTGEMPVGRTTWENTRILFPERCPKTWHEYLTEQDVNVLDSFAVGDALGCFPVALLLSTRND
jgi:(1->4)-alpha-D-glucan 1-alpha-D-glucosylmutase